MKPIYEARDLVKTYNGHIALSLAEFHLQEGEMAVLTGPNGSGKSTLLRLLAFLEVPTSGTLRYHGAQTTPRREVTMLLQEPYLLRAAVRENVTLGLRLRGEKRGLDARFQAAMQAVGFADPAALARRGPRELSGGERQRVALAARLALRPAVLLLDEPTSNVDAKSARAIVAAVEHSLSEGISVVCATHDSALLRALKAARGREIRLGEDWDAAAR